MNTPLQTIEVHGAEPVRATIDLSNPAFTNGM